MRRTFQILDDTLWLQVCYQRKVPSHFDDRNEIRLDNLDVWDTFRVQVIKHMSTDFNKVIFNASPKLISPAFGGNATDSVSHCLELFCSKLLCSRKALSRAWKLLLVYNKYIFLLWKSHYSSRWICCCIFLCSFNFLMMFSFLSHKDVIGLLAVIIKQPTLCWNKD